MENHVSDADQECDKLQRFYTLQQLYKKIVSDTASPEERQQFSKLKDEFIADFTPISADCDQQLADQYHNFSHAVLSLLHVLP
ncbi:hypothetical protein C5B42_05115 [Candidatus Cerribacteria bacterium 'Amazon FNV 2010 28 9']|uniref:Uncharacterized protein n=1 Tax=Candidatus Cerribacteria bacterium 'Amazon FNV 2010 28 9' TaxID=2081795 RepID=A0A317JMY4_9BACT|nr:MAG: hypothetical protein C5B42_05115 [Candidatus Cerribacteria bacterium 'Amazon FNV 2010 28 9']